MFDDESQNDKLEIIDDSKSLLEDQDRILYHIFRTLSNKKTFQRNVRILELLNENPEHYLTKREIDRLLKDSYDDIELEHLSDDMRRLVEVNLIQNRSNSYHLTEIGTTIVIALEKIKTELRQPLLLQFTRAMLLSAIYEGKGVPINSDKHIRQIGFLIIETIKDLVIQERVLDWAGYLNKFSEIIQNLDQFIEYYKDEPELYQQLFNLKSQIELEFSNYHNSAQKAFNDQLSMIQAGFSPIKMKNALNLLAQEQLRQLENSIAPLFCETSPIENEILWQKLQNELMEVDKSLNEITVNDSQIITNILNEEQLNVILDDYLPMHYKYAKILQMKLIKDPIVSINEILPEIGIDWKFVAEFISSLPSIESDFNVYSLAFNRKINLNNSILTQTSFFIRSEEDNNGGDKN